MSKVKSKKTFIKSSKKSFKGIVFGTVIATVLVTSALGIGGYYMSEWIRGAYTDSVVGTYQLSTITIDDTTVTRSQWEKMEEQNDYNQYFADLFEFSENGLIIKNSEVFATFVQDGKTLKVVVPEIANAGKVSEIEATTDGNKVTYKVHTTTTDEDVTTESTTVMVLEKVVTE